MKKVLLIILIIFTIFTIVFLRYNQSFAPVSKGELIKNANNGDIKTMIRLNKEYHFAHLKDGIKYFRKWHKNISQKDNAKDIYDLALIYHKYSDIYVNSEEIIHKLLNLSSSQGYTQASLMDIILYVKSLQFPKAKKMINNKTLSHFSKKQLDELYLALSNVPYMNDFTQKVLYFMQNKGYHKPFAYYEKNIKKAVNERNKTKITELNREISDTKDVNLIEKIANFYHKRRKLKKSILFNKELLKYNPKNTKAYISLGKDYESLEKIQKRDKTLSKEYQKLSLSNYQKAFRLGDVKGAEYLLSSYFSKKEKQNKYFDLVEELKQTQKGKLTLVKHLQKNKMQYQANKILVDLAKNKNEYAIITLASLYKNKYNFNPYTNRIKTQWKEYIKNSNDKNLLKRFENAIFDATYSIKMSMIKDFEDITNNKYIQNDVLALREIYRFNRYKPKGIQALKKAAKFGDKYSILKLAKIYENSTKYKEIKAIRLYEDLIKAGDKQALWKLGNIYTKGKHKDIKKAILYFEKAVSLGDTKYAYRLTDYYLCQTCEDGKYNDIKKGISHLKRLIKLGEYENYIILGRLYQYKNKGVNKDLQKAKKYYQKAINHGIKRANFNLGTLYFSYDKHKTDDIIELDYKKAFNYFKASEFFDNSTDNLRRNYEATHILGICYMNGYGVEKDEDMALKYFLLESNPCSAYYIGRIMQNKKEYKKALKAYEKSAKCGIRDSLNSLGILYEKGWGTKKDVKKALEYYQKAYKNGSTAAAYNIALLYHFGEEGIKKDIEKAKNWYKKSPTKDGFYKNEK